MTQIFSFCNQKGGVGKTTTAVNLATGLAQKDKKILLIDIDPQGNATSGIGLVKTDLPLTFYELISGESQITQTIIKSDVTNLDVIASNSSLAGAEIELIEYDRREFILKNAIEHPPCKCFL